MRSVLRALLYRMMDTETHLTDGRGIKFFLGFPLLQRQNCLNLKEPQTLFGCLWVETATTCRQYERVVDNKCLNNAIKSNIALLLLCNYIVSDMVIREEIIPVALLIPCNISFCTFPRRTESTTMLDLISLAVTATGSIEDLWKYENGQMMMSGARKNINL